MNTTIFSPQNAISMIRLRLFLPHTGVWEETFTRIGPDWTLIDKWRSKLTIRMLSTDHYHQVNEYF